MDRIVELVRQLGPETAPPSLEVQARQREALLRAMASADEVGTRPRHWRPRHAGWVVALAGAAAAAVATAMLVPGSSPATRPPISPSGSRAVLAAVTTALAGTSGDLEEAQSTVTGAPAATTSWVAVASGACRTDLSLDGQPRVTLFDEYGKVVFVDYGKQEWWTRGSSGVTCEPLTPQAIERAVSTGRVTVVGHGTVDGQPSLKLELTETGTGLHPTPKLTTLWVNATTYLPIQSTSTGHATERTVFTWVPATATATAVLDITVPAGFHQVPPPPPQAQVVP